MRITFRNRIVAIAAGAVLAAAVPAAAAAAAGASAPAARRGHQAAGDLTPARLAAAAVRAAAARSRAAARRAADARSAWLTGETAGRGLRLVHRGAVAAAVGKIFFTLGDTDYVCSGVLVRGGRAPVVLTAAHCVGSADGRWASDWTFVPGYRNGTAPYGQYTARRFYVSPRWKGPGGGNERYDIAFVRVTPATLYGGSGVAAPPRGLPVRFASSQAALRLARTYVFGYPAEAPFSGRYPNYCAGPAARAGHGTGHRGAVLTACQMTAGDSGGPWLAGFSPRPGAGTVVAVTTFKLSGRPRVLYGTVLGPGARDLYLEATGRREPAGHAKHAGHAKPAGRRPSGRAGRPAAGPGVSTGR